MPWVRSLTRHAPRSVSLLVVWLLLSGHYTPLVTGLGVASAVLVTWLAHRMGLGVSADLLRPLPRAIAYAPWLVVQIARASVDVIRRVLDPRLPISPVLVDLPARQRSDLWRVVYANSITLTPGTIAVGVSGDRLKVHALTQEGAGALAEGDLQRRVAAIPGR